MSKRIALIGAGISCGGLKKGPAEGPSYLKTSNSLWIETLRKSGISVQWENIIKADENYFWRSNNKKMDPQSTIPIVAQFSEQVAQVVSKAVKKSQLPIVVGGDHSVAIGSWSGIIHSLNIHQNFGLIWLDAHMDAHTPQTSPSQAIHGMPLAVLLGHGDTRLTQIADQKIKISPKNLVLIGVRSYEAGEMEFLKKMGVKVFMMETVRKRGFKAIFDEAIEIVTHQTSGFGISIDLDAFDPEEAPGVTTPCPSGLRAFEVLPALNQVAEHPRLVGIEIAEFNPVMDQSKAEMTVELLKKVLFSLIQPKKYYL